MNEGTLVRRNLMRNRVRAVLLIACIAIAFMIYGVLGSVLTAFELKDQVGSADRLMVTNRIGFMQRLPISYVEQVGRVPGVAAVSPVRWSMAYWREPKDVLSIVMIDPDSYLPLAKDIGLSPTDRQAFAAARDGLLVGRETAARYGWKRGDAVTLQTFNDVRQDGSRAWPFVVSGIYTAAQAGGSEAGIAGHYAYFNEALMGGRDTVNWITVKTVDPARNEAVGRAVDGLFTNSPAVTKTQSEAALGRAFLAQIGDVVTIVRLVVGAAFAIILCVVGNTMVFAIRERTREIGILKTLGFARTRVLRMVAGEVAVVTIVGSALGLSAAALLVHAIRAGVKDVLPGLAMSSGVVGIGVGLIMVLMVATGFLPVLKAARLSIIDSLGRK